MEIEKWSMLLYYPLGLLPSLFFFLRFFIQWIQSEKKKQSIVDKTFWNLSLYGNSLLILHYFIQLQYLFLMVQVVNIAIAWRNLNLIKQNKKSLSIWSFISFLFLVGGVNILFFFYKTSLFIDLDYFSIPLAIRQKEGMISLGIEWKCMGMIGTFLFASRFWIQWWESEKKGKSELGEMFWVLSLFGSGLSLIYCLSIQDHVSTFHYAFGLIPCMRNLLLIQKRASFTSTSNSA